MAPLKTMVVLASNREGRMSKRVGVAIQAALEKAGHEVSLIDPGTLDLPILQTPLHFYPDPAQAPESLKELNEKIKEQDAFVVCTAEYNRCIPPALTNFFDHFPTATFAYRPSAIVAYSMGSQGGAIAASQLKVLLAEFGCAPSAFGVFIPEVHEAIDESGVPNDRVAKNIEKAVTQLNWYANALKVARSAEAPPSFVNLWTKDWGRISFCAGVTCQVMQTRSFKEP